MEKQKRITFELFTIGELIKKERTSKKITLKKLAIEVFGSEHFASLIVQIEKGKKPGVEFMTIAKILKALEIKTV